MPDRSSGGTASLTFIGTATTVLRLGGCTLLTDPNFLRHGQRAYLGYGLSSVRLTDPAARPQDLPPIHAVLLSHLHGDHFDRVARRELPSDVPIFSTPEAADRLQSLGFTKARALQRWDSRVLGRSNSELVRLTAVPGTHGPGVLRRLLPAVMGSVVELERDGRTVLRVYITGDTLCEPSLREITSRCGDIDAMVIHLGGIRMLGMQVTMDGRQGAELVDMLRPRVVVPVHHNDYRAYLSPLDDFLAEVRGRDLPVEVHPMERGDTIPLPIRTAPSEAGRGPT